MPPWLPAAEDYRFDGENRLTADEIETIDRWVGAGCPEGDPAVAPAPPKLQHGWKLGEPDLVVQMPKAYTLPAEGTDVWRRFVIEVPLDKPRYVRAVEIRPGNKKIVHHAIAYIDATEFSRRREGKDGQPGYDGMVWSPDVHSPDGHFLSWLPGMTAYAEDPELSWRLDPGTDFVVEAHMLPSGKPEEIQVSVGLYFTEKPPTKFPCRILLHSEEIDIPADTTDFEVGDSYLLPVDLTILGVHPHAHLLGKQMKVTATMPNGTKKTLLEIPDWNFAWQNAYRFTEPVSLPAGTTLAMRIRYDNSAANVRNPFNPPRRVHFGFHSFDEMAQVTIQALPRDRDDASKFQSDFARHDLYTTIKGYRFRLAFEPDDVRLRTNLGIDLFATGERDEAMKQLLKAVELAPDDAEAHYYLGLGFSQLERLSKARAEFEAAIHADPEYHLALSELGSWHLQEGNLDDARQLLNRAIAIRPHDAVTHNNLAIVYFRLRKLPEAERETQAALAANPSYGPALENLQKLRAMREK